MCIKPDVQASLSPPPGEVKASLKAARPAAAAAAGGGGLRYPLSNDEQEVVLVVGLLVAGFATSRFDRPGSGARLRDLGLLYLAAAVVRRKYTAYLEAAWVDFPERRTQKTAVRRAERDTMGRTAEEEALIDYHDRLTGLSTFALYVLGYAFAGERLYPAGLRVPDVVPAAVGPAYWVARLLAYHYCFSFGMYWAHRYLHVNTFLWRHVHSLHHFAKTPQARSTYMDHWFDNFFNAVICEFTALVLVPLPFRWLAASKLLRICESLEKHSGVSGAINVVHTMQQGLPFAQMPHHHDWHHEGHKGSNYTFASLGGIWDYAFGTRHHGRADGHAAPGATRLDKKMIDAGKAKKKRQTLVNWDHPAVTPLPLLAFFAAAAHKWRLLDAAAGQ